LKKKVIIILFFCLLFGVGFLVYNGQRNLQMRELYYSGTIEAKQAGISSWHHLTNPNTRHGMNRHRPWWSIL
jgi:hypothetical protein